MPAGASFQLCGCFILFAKEPATTVVGSAGVELVEDLSELGRFSCRTWTHRSPCNDCPSMTHYATPLLKEMSATMPSQAAAAATHHLWSAAS